MYVQEMEGFVAELPERLREETHIFHLSTHSLTAFILSPLVTLRVGFYYYSSY